MGNLVLRNNTDTTFWFSTNMLGPLEWRLVGPGEYYNVPNTGRVWYTIKATDDEPSVTVSILAPLLFSLGLVFGPLIAVVGIAAAVVGAVLSFAAGGPFATAIFAAGVTSAVVGLAGVFVSVAQGTITLVMETAGSSRTRAGVYADGNGCWELQQIKFPPRFGKDYTAFRWAWVPEDLATTQKKFKEVSAREPDRQTD